MIGSGVAVEGGGGGGLYGGGGFLRPLPPPSYAAAPVNLAPPHAKEEPEDYSTYLPPPPPPRIFAAPPAFPPLHYGPYGALYPAPYTPVVREPPPPPPPSLRPPRFKEPPAAPPAKPRLLRKTTNSRSAGFSKGSLIQLASGDLKRVEELRTEDFISSADQSPALRLDPSTVVRIDSPSDRTTVLTLSYGETRAQVEVESAAEHPYFVYGQGWASCRPERTLQVYGLKVSRLQVGDVCISLSPRPRGGPPPTASHDPGRKRRWSAPDQLPDSPPPPPPHPHHRPKDS